jgi:N-methylhydantoinase B
MRVNGGLGARAHADGISALGWPAPVTGTPIEVTENEMPMLFLKKELIQNSGGAGRYRGGLAHAFVWRSFSERPITIGVRLDRVEHPPLGLFGGRPGSPAAVLINDRPVHSKKTVRLTNDEVLTIQAPGSGGYGNPSLREPQRVVDDVLDGYISAERAFADYGISVDAGESRSQYQA